jgi:mycothiol synthase
MKGRPLTDDDLPALAELLAADEEYLNGVPSHIGLGDVRDYTSMADLANDSWAFEDDDGLAGAGWFFVIDDVAVAAGIVHPRAKGRGLGAQLLERNERRARERGAPRIHQFAIGKDEAARTLLTSRGYEDVRHFYEMAIELDAAPAEPGVPVEAFRQDDARAFYHAIDEAFQDHWEHHTLGFDTWWERHSSKADFDPSLWFLIRDGDEVAAAIRNEGPRNGGGYVAALGVRRPWRGKGYAKALLLRAFKEFYERGLPRVTLGVDAASPTGATHLYERVGMHVEQENVVFEKALA